MNRYVIKVNTDDGLLKTCLVETSMSHVEFSERLEFIVANASDVADVMIDLSMSGFVVSEVPVIEVFID